MTGKKKWIDTPGLKDVLENEVPLANKLLVEGRYPILVRGTPRTGKSHIRDSILKELEKSDLKKGGEINCAALPDNLIESELFGFKKGSFTGADKDKRGLLSSESKTPKVIFLEEIGELPQHLQAKLLVFFDTNSFRPLGEELGKPEESNLRIIATSNAEDDKFRPDFLARFWEISVPPIHERREDIPDFLKHFLEGDEQKLSSDELYFLMTHNWPGGVTEIEKVCIRIAYFGFPQKRSRTLGLYVQHLISKSTPYSDTWYPYAFFCQKLVLDEEDDTIKQLFPHFCVGSSPEGPAPSYEIPDLVREWNAWCYFFGHDPKSPLNINKNGKESVSKLTFEKLLFKRLESNCDIDERYALNPQLEYFIDFLKSRNLWNDEGRLLLNNLRYEACEKLSHWYFPEKKDENQKKSKELFSLEQTSPKEYANQFWEHQIQLGRNRREIKEKYGLAKQTVAYHMSKKEK